MAKKTKSNIKLYVIIGIVILIIGIVSWGFATNWKFVGSSKTSAPVSVLLEKPIKAGTNKIILKDPEKKGFKIGQVIEFKNKKHSEKRTIVGFGSLILDRPLKFNYPAVETTITVISEPEKPVKPVKPEKLEPKKTNGSSCINDNKCLSGKCIDGKCCNQYKNKCKKCSDNGTKCTECTVSNYLDNGTCKDKKTKGSNCAIDNQCQIGKCIDGKCCTQDKTKCQKCSTDGIQCAECKGSNYLDDNGNCLPWATCDSSKIETTGTITQNQVCCAPKPLNGDYNSNTFGDCSLKCDNEYYLDNNGTCKDKKTKGSNCAIDNECQIGKCIDGKCCTQDKTKCQECNTDGTNCTKCENEYYLYNDSCYPKLGNGKYHLNHSGITVEKKCTNDNLCLSENCIDEMCCNQDKHKCKKCSDNGTNCTECKGSNYLDNGTCKSWKTCAVGSTYETQPPTTTSNRICGSVTDPGCNSQQYKQIATLTTDNKCKNLTPPCGSATSTSTYESQSPNATRDRICTLWKTCTLGSTYETQSPNATRDRICTPITSPCVSSGKSINGPRQGASKYVMYNKLCYETQSPTLTRDRICSKTKRTNESCTSKNQCLAPRCTIGRLNQKWCGDKEKRYDILNWANVRC